MKTIFIGSIILLLIGIIIWQWYDKKEKERKAKEEQEKEKKNPKEGFRTFLKIIKGLIKVGKIIGALIKRIKNVGLGIARGAEGVGLSIKNIPVIAVLTIADGFMVGVQSAKYGFRWVVCSIEKMKYLHYCFVFYILDWIFYVIHMIIRSTLYFLDEFFGIRDRFGGHGLVELLDTMLEYMGVMDDMIYSLVGYHVFRYPELIQDMCYRCKLPLNTDDLRRANRIMYNDMTTRITPLTAEFSDKFMQAGDEFAKVFADI